MKNAENDSRTLQIEPIRRTIRMLLPIVKDERWLDWANSWISGDHDHKRTDELVKYMESARTMRIVPENGCVKVLFYTMDFKGDPKSYILRNGTMVAAQEAAIAANGVDALLAARDEMGLNIQDDGDTIRIPTAKELMSITDANKKIVKTVSGELKWMLRSILKKANNAHNALKIYFKIRRVMLKPQLSMLKFHAFAYGILQYACENANLDEEEMKDYSAMMPRHLSMAETIGEFVQSHGISKHEIDEITKRSIGRGRKRAETTIRLADDFNVYLD